MSSGDGSVAVQTFWRYVRFQAMMLVFGCVGPIFLTLYFATQPDPAMKWAYWFGLFITAGDVLIALWLTSTSSGDDDKTPMDIRIGLALAERNRRRLGLDDE
ncbi:hypothetical protein [Mycobacterium sp. PS03-16]|uniref:hypothetical protein n=1 Tax=Mycobacterium sp. PS03-16 TaxID=2559611 RepID=UPI001FD75795|nr:hypothetical protein [Mycobacterium sp. PS03-16]